MTGLKCHKITDVTDVVMSRKLTYGADPQEEAAVAVLVVAGFRLVGATLPRQPLGRAGAGARARAGAAIVQVHVAGRFGLLRTVGAVRPGRRGPSPGNGRLVSGGEHRSPAIRPAALPSATQWSGSLYSRHS